jgi:hypothetical protein
VRLSTVVCRFRVKKQAKLGTSDMPGRRINIARTPRNANGLEKEEESAGDDQPILSSHFRKSPPVMITGGWVPVPMGRWWRSFAPSEWNNVFRVLTPSTMVMSTRCKYCPKDFRTATEMKDGHRRRFLEKVSPQHVESNVIASEAVLSIWRIFGLYRDVLRPLVLTRD